MARATSSYWDSGRNGAANRTELISSCSTRCITRPPWRAARKADGVDAAGEAGGGGNAQQSAWRREAESVKAELTRLLDHNRAYFTARGPRGGRPGQGSGSRSGRLPARPRAAAGRSARAGGRRRHGAQRRGLVGAVEEVRGGSPHAGFQRCETGRSAGSIQTGGAAMRNTMMSTPVISACLDAVKESVGRRKRLPHLPASPSATWDRRFRLSTRRRPEGTPRGSAVTGCTPVTNWRGRMGPDTYAGIGAGLQARRRFPPGQLRGVAQLLPQAGRVVQPHQAGRDRQVQRRPRILDGLHLQPREPGATGALQGSLAAAGAGPRRQRGAGAHPGPRPEAVHPHRWRPARQRGGQPPAHHPARLRPGGQRGAGVQGHPPEPDRRAVVFHQPRRPEHRGQLVSRQCRHAVRSQPAAGALAGVRGARQQPRRLHAQHAGDRARSPRPRWKRSRWSSTPSTRRRRSRAASICRRSPTRFPATCTR